MAEPVYGRLLTLRLSTTTGPVTFVSVYALTLSSTPNTKDEFYENVAFIINNIPNKEQLVLLDDFNAYHDTWCSYFGHFGVGRINENGPLITRAVHRQHLLQDKASTQGPLETPALKALAPTGSDPCQARRPPERSLLSQYGLRHTPHLGVLQDPAR